MDTKFAARRSHFVRRLVVCAVLAFALSSTACSSTKVIVTGPEPIIQRSPVPTFTPRPLGTRNTNANRRPTLVPATPTTSPTVFIPPTPTPIIYQVKQGDTLNALAIHFGVPLEQLMGANGLNTAESLQVGQSLIIPVVAVPGAVTEYVGSAESGTQASAGLTTTEGGTEDGVGGPALTHYVKIGETLSVIANLYAIKLDDLLFANGLAPDAQLTAGDALMIPRGPYTPIPTMTPVPITETPTPSPTSDDVTPTATATPPPTETAVPTPVVHVVQRGDVPAGIAARYGISLDALLRANPNVVPSRLSPGDRLVIPGQFQAPQPTATPTPVPASPTPDNTIFIDHTITNGETITDLYVKYNITYERLVAYNTIADPNNLAVGGVLRIALGTPTPTPTTIPSPTITPTPLPAYLPPLPLMPANSSIEKPRSRPLVLNWTASGLLGPDEYYLVRLRLYNAQEMLVTTLSTWTQTTSWRVGDDIFGLPAGSYKARWDVQVMRRTSKPGEELAGAALSARSDQSQFEVIIDP